MTRFEKMEGYPEEIQGRFNSFITTQFDDSLSVEMQIRSLIKWISSSRKLINDIVDYINLFIELFDERLQEEIVGRLNEWLADGTLAQIINNDVFDMKADKTFVDSEIERLEQFVDSEIERLEQKDENLVTQLAQTNDLLSKTIKVIKVENFGAVADGITDDRVAIQSAIDSVEGDEGAEIHLMNGVHYLSDSIVIEKDNISLIGSENTWLDAKNNHMIRGVISVQGAITNEHSIGVNLVKGQRTTPVPIDSEYAIIKTPEKYNEERYYYRKGEIVKTERNLFVDGLADNYTATGYDLTIQELKPVKNFTLKNVKFTKNYNENAENDSRAVNLQFVVDSYIENVYGHHFDVAHIYIDRCYNVVIDRTKFEDGNASSSTCYGVSINNSTRHIHVNHIEGKRLRHLTAFGGNGLGLARFCTINYAHDSLTYAGSFDVHNIAEDITYNHCVGESSQFGGTRTTFNHCYFNAPTLMNDPFYFRLPATSDLVLNDCVFNKIVGFVNRSDKTLTHNIEIKSCVFLIDDTNFTTVDKFNNFKVNMFDTKFESVVKPILSETNTITNKTLIEMRFGEGSVFNQVVFKNLINPIQLLYNDMILENCQFINTYGYEVNVNSVLSPLKNIKIDNNTFKSDLNMYSGVNRYVIRLSGNNEIKNISVSNNVIEVNERNKKGILIDDTKNSRIVNNHVFTKSWGIELTDSATDNIVALNMVVADGNSIMDSGQNIVVNNHQRYPVSP